MNKEVKLTISGLHTDTEAAHASVETVVEAQYFKRGNSHYLLYEEMQEGFDKPSQNRIKFREDLLELNRKGLMETHMVFEEGKTHMTNYSTPYGQMVLGIHTKSIQVQEQENRILVNVEYQLEADGEYLEDSRIILRIE